MYKYPIIVFEGIEGSGKSFHIKNIQNHLNKNRIKYIKLREPGGSKNSEKIRKLILNNKSNLNKNTDLLLYLASRSENVEKIIEKNYRKKVILIDRFVDSTIAYQHHGMGINKNIIKILNKFLLKKINVDFTFLNIVSEKNLKKRLFKRKNLNRYDKFNYSFYKKVQKGFVNIAKKKTRKYMIINTNKKISENKTNIQNKINKLLRI